MEFTKSDFEKQKDLLAETYNRAMAYTNFIMVGGYAGFFALWGLTKEYLSKGQVYWSALFILISIGSFVVFEVFKMIVNGIHFQAVQKAVSDPDRFQEVMRNHNKESSRLTIRMGKIWISVLIVSIWSGLSGGGVLAYAFISGLTNLYGCNQ